MFFYVLMGLILLGAIILGIAKGIEYGSVFVLPSLYILMGVLTALIVFLIGIFVPSKHYDAPEVVEETKLVSLSNDLGVDGNGSLFFVSVDSENIYTYRVEMPESKFASDSEKAYEVKTVKNAVEVETTDGSPARLVEYVEKGHVSFWSMGIPKYTNVFYVPEGTITKTISLK